MSHPRFALLVALVLLVAYFWGNSQPEVAGLIPTPWDKLAHLAWYAVLAGLLLLGLGRRPWPWVLVGTLLLAGWDEWHQFALPGRSPDFDDWLADALGAVAGVWISRAIGQRARAASANGPDPGRADGVRTAEKFKQHQVASLIRIDSIRNQAAGMQKK
ncbi:MAG: VanZ family protein [Thiobacillus sp.]|nr:VanZ family protein [Thiobacillus sp.]